MPFIIGAAIAGSAAIGAGASLYGSSKASSAANNAANLQAKTAAANRNLQNPYLAAGEPAAQTLATWNANGWNTGQPNYLQMAQDAMPTTPQAMTQSQLEQTPGYQFQMNQGLQQTQNSAALRGLGISGAALKGAAAYSTGLANSNYQQQFANQQTLFGNQQTRSQDYLNLNTGQQGNTTNLYNRLAGTAAIGENAAAGTGTNQSTSAATQGTYIQGAGNAAAAGASGVGTAATGAANSYLGYNALQGYLAMNGGGAAGSGTTSTYVSPATGQNYLSSSNPAANF